MEKSKIKIDIKNIFGEILFSFEKENNTLIDTLLEASRNNADLRYADLKGANLRGADLGGSNFYNANLRDADLNFVNLNNAYLGKKEKNRFGRILKKKIIVYKKCVDKTIVKLEIPKGAIVFSINNKKCRTNVAKVLQIDDAEGNKINQTVSNYDQNFKYKTGKTIEIKDFDLMYNVECGAGIHFFKTKKEAQEEPNYIQIKKSKKGEEK